MKCDTKHFRRLNMFTAEGFSERRTFVRLSNHVFETQSFQKYLSYEAFFVFVAN